MKKHTKIYMDWLGYDVSDFIPCEVCKNQAVDIHHIKARGMGGSKTGDHIDNLMALCRPCHEQFGDITSFRPFLERKHKERLVQNDLGLYPKKLSHQEYLDYKQKLKT